VLDLDAYLERVGLSGRPSPAEVHRAHSTTIPFENLDPHAGIPVSVVPEDVERKMVDAGRGGYCFEQNLLLKQALEALGASAELHLARVRLGAPPGVHRPRAHLVLHVRAADGDWLADVGFGAGTQLDLHPFALGVESEQSGWRYRLIEDGPEWVMQTATADGWADVHSFHPHPVPAVDIETANWFVCTHPASPFVTGLIVGTQDDDGRRSILNDWGGELTLREATPAGERSEAVELQDVPALLAERFSLPGFELGPDERLRNTRG
jgi:N-hydroxyarylamine O-acetyltransferase